MERGVLRLPTDTSRRGPKTSINIPQTTRETVQPKPHGVTVSMAVSISDSSFGHHRQALGAAETEPRISWQFTGNAVGREQSSYKLEVSRGSEGDARASNVSSSDFILVRCPDSLLHTAESATVGARAHGHLGQPSTPWSDWVAVNRPFGAQRLARPGPNRG